MNKIKKLGYYYTNSTQRGFIGKYDFDKNGYVVYKQNGIEYFQPVSVANFALQSWDAWLSTQKKEHLNSFIKHADLLVKKQKITNEGFGVWLYNYDFPSANQKAPWISAMAQGKAISVLLRAWQLTKKETYLKASDKAIKPFDFSIKDGGVRLNKGDLVYYEEFPPTSKGKNILSSKEIIGNSVHTLNGFIYSLFGLYDFYLATGSEKAKKLFGSGIETLKKDLNKYDLGFGSAYDQNVFDPKDFVLVLLEEKNRVLEVTNIVFGDEVSPRGLSLSKSLDLNFELKEAYFLDWGWGKPVKKNNIYYRKVKNGPIRLKTPEKLKRVEVSIVGGSDLTPLLGVLRSESGLWKIYPSKSYLLDKKIKTFIFSLPDGLLTRRMNPKYHLIHLNQLKALFNITSEKIFLEFFKKWSAYNEIISTQVIGSTDPTYVQGYKSFYSVLKKHLLKYYVSSENLQEFFIKSINGLKNNLFR